MADESDIKYKEEELKKDKIERGYDYGSVSDDHKIIVREIIDYLRTRTQVPVEMIIDEMKHKWSLEEVPMEKIEDSVWGQLTKDEKLGQSVQGFLLKEKDGKKVRVPHIGFSANLDYLNEFVNRLFKKLEKVKKK